MVADAIEPAWRNSVAHREVAYDASHRKLVLRGDLVDPQGLRSRRAIGDAVVYGFECGVALARASSPKLAQRLDRRVTAAQHPQIVSSRLADRFAQHGTVAVGITVRGEEVFLELADGTIYDAAGVIAELAATCREYKIGNVELRCGTRPPLSASAEALVEVARLCREAGGANGRYRSVAGARRRSSAAGRRARGGLCGDGRAGGMGSDAHRGTAPRHKIRCTADRGPGGSRRGSTRS